MKGGIYTNQKCRCGGKFVYDERRNGLFCKCGQMATKGFFVRYGRDIQRRFSNDLLGAQRFLTGLRFKEDEGTLDPRDYRTSNPLGFENLVDRWLKLKIKQVKPQSLTTYTGYMHRAVDAWGNRNIKTISDGDIEDFLFDNHLNKNNKPISSKTRHEMKAVLSQFFKWLCRREKMIDMPAFPEIGFEMAFRDIVDIATQSSIIERVKQISWVVNPKIWWGIKVLSENPNVRPGELRNIKEGDINLDMGLIQIRRMKERSLKKGKFIQLDAEDIQFLRTMPQALPNVFFFRHRKGAQGAIAGDQFGVSYFNKWWKRACRDLGVEGVTVYSGTKHSTVTAMSEIMSPEEIRRGGSEHSTNSAFERYLVPNAKEKLRFKQALKKLKSGAAPVKHHIGAVKEENI